MGRRGWWLFLAGGTVALATYPLLGELAGSVLYRAVGLACVAAIVAGVRVHRLARPLPWLLLAGGQLAFVAGDALWDFYERVVGTTPSPSMADVLYLAGYPLLAAGLAVLARRRSPHRDFGGLLDAAILAVGAGVVMWVFLVVPAVSDTSLSGLERLVSAAYPLADLLLLALAVRLLLVPGVRPRAFRLLVLSVLSTLVCDAVFAARSITGDVVAPLVLELGWLAGYLLMGATVLDPSVRGVGDPIRGPLPLLTPRRLVLLALASFVAPATLVVQTLQGGDIQGLVIGIGSAALFALVVLRMSGLTRVLQRQAAQLAAQARTDPLTGVANRRAWEERLPLELARAASADAPVCVALVDLDHFKAFNDALGHCAGDALLREAVHAWRRELRSTDLLARHGGEEFTVLLPGCTEEEAMRTLDRVRRATPGGQSCSAGVAAWDGWEGAAELLARADRALYEAKHAGRDRVHLAA